MRALLAAGLAAALAWPAAAQEAVPPSESPAPTAQAEPAPAAAPAKLGAKAAKPARKAAPAFKPSGQTGPTPLGERVATLAALDKLTGEVQQFELRPGDEIRFGRLTIRLKACEATPPWDPLPETGAFAQVFETDPRSRRTTRVFSGWLFKRSPSLNPFANAGYGLFVRNCAMRFPDTGPETVLARAGGGDAAPSRSSAKKSARRETASDSNAR